MSFFECCQLCTDDRHPGCAGHCPKYATARANYDAAMDSLKYGENDQYAIDMFRKRNDAIAKLNARRPGNK